MPEFLIITALGVILKVPSFKRNLSRALEHKKDIELNQLWKLVENNLIIGIIVLTKIEDVEYKSVKWLTENGNNLYIHRLAVHPNYQGKGNAQLLMHFAENYAEEHNFYSIRLDTFSKNLHNQQFYEKRNYIKLASIYFPKQS